jgi:hypothetical protein
MLIGPLEVDKSMRVVELFGRGTGNEAQQILRRFRLGQRGFRQGAAELTADTQQEFDARQAVQPQVALEVAAHAHPFHPSRARLDDQGGEHAQQALRGLCWHLLQWLY